jgi:hypothetical protein
MTHPELGKKLSQILMVILVGAGLWIKWREGRGQPVSSAFKAFFTVGGRRGSGFWTLMLMLWFVGGWLPLLAFPQFGWTVYVYLAGMIFLAGKAMGFWNKGRQN